MGLKGSVKALSLDQLLEFLGASQHEGRLRITYKDKACVLCLTGGALYVDQRGEVSARLGEVLIQRGVVDEAAIAQALEVQRETGKRIGEALLDMGLVDDKQLSAAHRSQLEEEIYDLFMLDAAFFGFELGLTDEFRERIKSGLPAFPVRSILMEAARRFDEWNNIKLRIKSHKRIYQVTSDEDGLRQGRRLLKDVDCEVGDAFDKERSVEEVLSRLGVTQFAGLSLIARLITEKYLVPVPARDLESLFRDSVEKDLRTALKYYECALELSECEPRLRHFERSLYSDELLKDASQSVTIGATVRGRRAFQTLLTLFRQAIPCNFFVREDARETRFVLQPDAIVWKATRREIDGEILKALEIENLLVSADADEAQAQVEGGASVFDFLVGSGRVLQDDWERAELSVMFEQLFSLFFWNEPYVQVETGSALLLEEEAGDLRIELKGGADYKVKDKIKHWERITRMVPSIHAYFLLTSKGRKMVTTPFDDLNLFDGRRTLEQILKVQSRSAEDFFGWLFEQTQGGRIAAFDVDDYRQRLDQAVTLERLREGIAYCKGAISAGLQISYFSDRLEELAKKHGESGKQEAPSILSGDLRSFSLAEILQSFHMSKRSGTLRIFTKKREKEIYFEDGQVFLLEIDDDTGGFLLDAGFMDVIGSESFGDGFVASGLVTVDELEDALAEQIKEEVYDVFLWDGADFVFTRDALPAEFYSSSPRVTKYSLNTALFLMEAVRRITEWEQIREVVIDDEVVVSFDSYETKMRAVTERGFQEVLLLIDGRHTVMDILRISAARRFHAVALIADLIQGGALAIVELSDHDEKESTERAGNVDGAEFVKVLQELSSDAVSGMLRVTDGRRSQELAWVGGQPHRSAPFKKGTGDPDSDRAISTRLYAQDFAEVVVMRAAKYQFLPGVLPPALEQDEGREPYELDTAPFIGEFSAAGGMWIELNATVDRDKCLGWVNEDMKTFAATIPIPAEVIDWIDGKRCVDEIIRAHPGGRFLSFMALGELLKQGFLIYVEPEEEESEEDWDFGI